MWTPWAKFYPPTATFQFKIHVIFYLEFVNT